MHRSKLSLLWSTTVAFALTMGACGEDDGSADDSNDDDGSTTSETGSTVTDPTEASASVESSTTDPTVDPTTDEGNESFDPDTGDGSTTVAVPEACMPDLDDDECATCTKESCCDQLDACAQDEACSCVYDCAAMQETQDQSTIMMCAEECEADFLAVTPALLLIDTCQTASCSEQCGGVGTDTGTDTGTGTL